MAALRWKIFLGSMTFVAIVAAEVTFGLFDISHALMAPTFALIAAVSHSATLIPEGQSAVSQVTSFFVRITLVSAVLLSATHWLLSHDTDTNQFVLPILALVGTVGVIIGLIVAAGEEAEAYRSRLDASD